MNIFVTIPVGTVRDTFFDQANLDYLNSLGQVRWNDKTRNMTRDELCEVLPGVDAVVTGWGSPCFDEKVMACADSLKIVAHVAGTVSWLVTDATYDRGVRVVCGNQAFARSVAEGAIAYMLSAQRNIPFFSYHTHKNGWSPEPWTNRGLLGKKVGIVGYGAVTGHLIPMLKAFDTEIMVFSNHMTEETAAELGVKKASLEEVFSQNDIVTLHCASTAKNYHLVNAELLAKMPDGALLVNTSRGDVLDEEAVVKEVQSGRLRVMLDVYEDEEPPLKTKLRGMEGATLMPHQAGPTIDYRPTAARIALEDIARLAAGEPLRQEITRARKATMTKK